MDHEEPSKKRVRATQACVLCRKKKIKCDGTKPECLHCQEAQAQCEYTESKKRGPRKGYVQLLEERLAQMEKRLVRLGGTAALMTDPAADDELNALRSTVAPSFTRDPLQRLADENDGLPPQETVMHLVDLFFKHINAVFPIVHRPTLKKAIEDGTVSKPLLWSVLAIGARYSDDPNIKTDPPYWAGEKFAAKATSLIDASLLEPTMPNLQFWGIMAALEYGRASGSKSWIYASLAIRFCQELGLNKEETLSTPILSKDGTIDTVAMALRRRVFWSCVCIDKFSSAGTNRPQGFTKQEVDAHHPTIPESLVLRDADWDISVSGTRIVNDSLMDISRHYMQIISLFGEITRVMNRSKPDSTSIVWPPVPEYSGLDAKLRSWKENLPERFQFTPKNLDFHREAAGANYFNIWLCMHAVFCSSHMVLHRGSLAYGDLRQGDVETQVYRAIQASIDTCKTSVRTATGVFRAMRDLCGCNILPYMGYSAYVFGTVLMTSTFSKGQDACRRSGAALKILYELIDGLRPYWPMCERLANTANDLLLAHSRLYQPQEEPRQFPFDSKPNPPPHYSEPTPTTSAPTPSPNDYSYAKPAVSYFVPTTGAPETTMAPLPPPPLGSQITPPISTSPGAIPQPPPVQQQQQPPPQQSYANILSDDMPIGGPAGDIDFDSLDFLNDSALFGQIMFDATRPTTSQPIMATYDFPGFQPDPTVAVQQALLSSQGQGYPTNLSPQQPQQQRSPWSNTT